MKVDEFDYTLVCDKEDLQTVLSFFKDYRVLPDYIESSISKILLKQLNIVIHDNRTIDDYYKLIPDKILKDFITDINSMFSTHKEVNYSNRHLAYFCFLQVLFEKSCK